MILMALDAPSAAKCRVSDSEFMAIQLRDNRWVSYATHCGQNAAASLALSLLPAMSQPRRLSQRMQFVQGYIARNDNDWDGEGSCCLAGSER